MQKIYSTAIVALGLVLAGCYVTNKPIVTASNAAFPFPDTRFTLRHWDKDTKAWETDTESGKITRVGDHYHVHMDDQAAKDDFDAYIADLGNGYYAAQARDKDVIRLDVVSFKDGIAYQYGMMCEDADKAFVAQGIVDSIGPDKLGPCTVHSLDQLRRAFDAKRAAGLVPQSKYEEVH